MTIHCSSFQYLEIRRLSSIFSFTLFWPRLLSFDRNWAIFSMYHHWSEVIGWSWSKTASILIDFFDSHCEVKDRAWVPFSLYEHRKLTSQNCNKESREHDNKNHKKIISGQNKITNSRFWEQVRLNNCLLNSITILVIYWSKDDPVNTTTKHTIYKK